MAFRLLLFFFFNFDKIKEQKIIINRYCVSVKTWSCSIRIASCFYNTRQIVPASKACAKSRIQRNKKMASSVPGPRSLPESRYDLSTYWGRIRHCAEISDPSMLLTTEKDLVAARKIIKAYREGQIEKPTPEFWHAKKQ